MNAPLERRAVSMRGAGRSGSRLALSCAANVHAAVDRRMPEARALANWLAQSALEFGLGDDDLPAGEDVMRPRTGLSLDDWQKVGGAIEAAAAAHAQAPDGTADLWVAAVGEALKLDGLARRLLDVALHYATDLRVERLFDAVAECRGAPDRLHRNPDLFALLLGAEVAEVAALLDSGGPLLSSGMLGLDRRGGMYPVTALIDMVRQETRPGADIYAQLLGSTAAEALPWDAFAHLGREAEVAADLLRAAVAGREAGIGVLLYGPPGTGKTSFAATLAARVGVRLRPVGESGWDGEEPERSERLGALRLAQRLATPGDTLLLFDEAEDLFVRRAATSDGVATSSRVFVHRVLEQGAVPVIWTANDIDALGPAVLRRMSMCIELKVPDLTTRTRLWRRMGAAEQVELPEEDAARLARLVPAAPAVAATSLRGTRLAGGGAETARLIVEGVARAVRGGALPAPEAEHDAAYDPALLNADTDLVALADRLVREGAPRNVSFLLSGPAGAGKSAWIRHLAARMGLPVLQRRASDLLGMYVGQTERRIADAFAEARDTGSFLVFDEADSLLMERAAAVRGWEVTQVNEMLTWMETHDLPFACTTNLVERLDTASLRRFLVKVRFDWLTRSQARAAFRAVLGPEAPDGIDGLLTLTPADFALVRRRAGVEGVAGDAAALLRMLARESEGRVGGRGGLGFGRGL